MSVTDLTDFSGHIKRTGNINRTMEMTEAGLSAYLISARFKDSGINLSEDEVRTIQKYHEVAPKISNKSLSKKETDQFINAVKNDEELQSKGVPLF
jgi:hypothetical protein